MLGIALVFITGALGPYIYRYKKGKIYRKPPNTKGKSPTVHIHLTVCSLQLDLSPPLLRFIW